MATKNTYTNETALAKVAEIIANCGDADLIAKIKTMHAAQVKRNEARKNAPRTPSKETLKNREIARAACEIIKAHGEPVTLSWIAEHCEGIYSASEAKGKMATAARNGWAEKVGTLKVDGKTRATFYVTEEF